jgi:serine/threonine protein kinase
VTHPNVVRIHDLGEVESTLYLTMEYVQGADLATLLQREPKLSLPRVLAFARQIAGGLAAAHRAGNVHRDLKPANVMVDAQDHALLMDFGIARSTSAATVHTMPGSLIGTLDYMAPEQARGEPADERTDVYAFGLILYELIAAGARVTASTAGSRASSRDSRRDRRRCGRSCRTCRQVSSESSTSACQRARKRGIRARTSCSPTSRRSTKQDARAWWSHHGRRGSASLPSSRSARSSSRRRGGWRPAAPRQRRRRPGHRCLS